jgi:putative protein-disulfide isomerase
MPRLLYLFDPLCGWCYGAAPALAALREPDVELLPTGLFSGPGARRIDAAFALHARSHDQRVAEQTGQRFTEAYRRTSLAIGAGFDSGAANAALTAVHLTAPEREPEALRAIQQARFVEGRDITSPSDLAALLAELGLVDAARRLATDDPELTAATLARTRRGAAWMRRLGAQGVPSLAIPEGDTGRLLPNRLLLAPPADLRAALETT